MCVDIRETKMQRNDKVRSWNRIERYLVQSISLLTDDVGIVLGLSDGYKHGQIEIMSVYIPQT